MQILAVVAIIQMRFLRTEVEKGSMRTALGHGLAEPKKKGHSEHISAALHFERE